MKPASAKRYLRALNKYRHAETADEYLSQRSKLNEETGCVIFTGGKDKDGYGQCHSTKVGKELKVTRTHQLAWVNKFGAIPKGMFVCHTCDNPSCINPDHLFLGTPNDNVQDMMKKNRYINPHSKRNGDGFKFTKEFKDFIRSLKGKMTSTEISKHYPITFSYVCMLWRETDVTK